MEGGTSNKDKLFFKLYEYISKLDNFACDDVSLEKEGRKKVLYISKKSKGKKRLAHCPQATEKAEHGERNITDRSHVEAGEEKSGPFCADDGRDDDDSYTISCSSSCSSSYSSRADEAETATPVAPRDYPVTAENDEEGGPVNVHSYGHTHPNKKTKNTKKKRSSGQRSNGHRSSGQSSGQRNDLLCEIENYYVISKQKRKMEEYKIVNEIKIINSQGSCNPSGMMQKINDIISAYKKIKDELDKLEKNKQFIYDTFYSIFLNYYSRYEELKVIKGNKRRVERHLEFYTNVDHFEKVLNHMEKNEYAYFIDMHNNSLQKSAGKVYSGEVLEGDDQSDYSESETDSGDEDGDVYMDKWDAEDIQNWGTSYGTEGGDTDGEGNQGEDEESHEIDNSLLSEWEKEEELSSSVEGYANATQTGQHHDEGAVQGGLLNGRNERESAPLEEDAGVDAMGSNPVKGQLRSRIWWAKKKKRRSSSRGILNGVATGATHGMSNGGALTQGANQPRRGKTKRGSEKNEICHMLEFSEKAIKFFKKNGTYLHAKAKLTKYQSIIRRILKYVINLFRDVLNNAELNMSSDRGGESLTLYGTSSFQQNGKEVTVSQEVSCGGKWWEGSNLSEKRLPGEDNHMNRFKSNDMKDSPQRINDEKDESNHKQPHEEANLTDELEDNQIYKNISMIYFSKYINELEYYKKFKIKCSSMRDVIYFIYEKSLVDENNLYTEEYSSLENFYVSTRVKLLNSNILSSNVLSNFEYLLKSDICKYIKNICLLAMYVSKLEVDLYTYIFNNNLNNSLNIILNNIGVCIFDCLHDCIHHLNNIQLIRKIIRIIYVDLIETYSDNSYRVICDYLKKICKILKDKLLYVIEMYISYYTKNTNATLPYVCFNPLRTKFINMVNNFLYDEYLRTSDEHTKGEGYPVKTGQEASSKEGRNGQVNGLFSSNENNHPIGESVMCGDKSEPVRNFENCDEEGNPMCEDTHNVDDPSRKRTRSVNSAESVESRDSMESLTSGRYAKESECNKNVLSEKNVYKPFSFHRRAFNKDTKFGLCGIDLNIIGTILILKTIHFIIDEETLLELFRECLENSFNSITCIYKEHMKNHPDDMFNGALYLIKNLSLLLYLFYKVTKDGEFVRFYLNSGLTEQLLLGASPKEWIMDSHSGSGKKEGDKMGAENENSILCFFKRVYNMSSQNVQDQILDAFNDAIYNFTVATVSRVCSPLIKILSMEYKENSVLQKEEEIKKNTHDFLNAKRSRQSDLQSGHKKVDFSFLREINFDLLKEYAEKINNTQSAEAPNCSNLDDVKKSLHSFKQNVCDLFPKIYFYVKLFICSNTEKPDESEFFPGLFSHIVGLLTYKIVGLLSEVYLIIRLKYADQVETIFEENYVSDIFLFLNSSEQYVCSFSDIHEYFDTNKNYNFWGE
ncbi:hypothetical protein AK88_04062 [Plasmodium fragile]|uniref:Uncharacterized protein n=1 Tax=Plasmodium fragile TaxID=5857 RepID=A0A0D9QH98_PLAFR|nr:uncharacterized protein AK88_04062 [Plasmodium fragile]KJP86343.1 hypothetical protein AK88_04062 [Plasmodium fragile]